MAILHLAEFSPDRCGNRVEPLELTTFIRKCYEFQGSRGGSFQDASAYCQTRGGLLVHGVDDLILPFISAELERRRDKLKSKLVWMGAQRRTGIGLNKRGWYWVNGTSRVSFESDGLIWGPHADAGCSCSRRSHRSTRPRSRASATEGSCWFEAMLPHGLCVIGPGRRKGEG